MRHLVTTNTKTIELVKKSISFIIYAFLLLGFSTCKKPGCIGNAGPVTTITRQLQSFNELVISDNINLVLTQGAEEKMEITAPENIISNISGNVSQNILTLSNTTDCRWIRDASEKINVHLFFKDLKKLDYKGSGTITNTDTLELDALHIESSSGAGNIILTLNNRYTGSYISLENASITLHGKSESCFTYTNNRGITDMSDFIVKKMVIDYEGLSDTYIRVTEELSAVIYHKGNIRYKGNPVITKSITHSSGRLIQTP